MNESLHEFFFIGHFSRFNFAHLARCAAAILRRADADIVRLGAAALDWPLSDDSLTFAHRALCACAIRRRAASETVRLPVLCFVDVPACRVCECWMLPSDSRAAIA